MDSLMQRAGEKCHVENPPYENLPSATMSCAERLSLRERSRMKLHAAAWRARRPDDERVRRVSTGGC